MKGIPLTFRGWSALLPCSWKQHLGFLPAFLKRRLQTMCGSLEQPGHLDARSLAFHSEVFSAVVGKLPIIATQA